MKNQKSRHSQILRTLLESRKPLTGKQLAAITGVTDRTIKNDIVMLNQALRDNGASISAIYSKGYLLNIHEETAFQLWLKQDVMNPDEENGYSKPDQRVKELIRFLLTVGEYVKLDDLVELMYLSKSTLQNDLKEARKLLEIYRLEIDVKPYYGIKLVGDEMRFRFAISEFLFSHDTSHSIYLNMNTVPIPDKELKFIRNIVLKHTSKSQLELSDVGLGNLVIHIAISCQRCALNHPITYLSQEMLSIQNKSVYKTAEQIINDLSDHMNMEFPLEERIYLAIHLEGSKVSSINSSLEEANNDIEAYQTTIEVIKTIEEKLGIVISGDHELVRSLYAHLKPAISRLRYGMSLRNPMLDSIKTRLPLAFHAGVLASTVLNERLGIHVSDNEIGYIALHIGAAIERSRNSASPKRCIVICSSGLGSSQLLYHKLRAYFGSRLEIVETIGLFQLKETSLRDLDFIITTIPIQVECNVPVILVDTLLGDVEMRKIEQAVYGLVSSKLPYLRPDLLFLHEDFETREEVIRYLCSQMHKNGLVGETFVNSVMQREHLSSTAYGNLTAIPHPLIPETNETVWAICTLRKPVLWEGKMVQFVCLLSIAAGGKTGDLSPMYNLLVKVVSDTVLVQKILDVKDYDSMLLLLQPLVQDALFH
ncbi:BglG family transcription antiterminator [Paenibacillus antibioticophila]|uniref:BglG family transcription antiterminator n=1 Tax=Paenibacillus antibioticophila TaxID=1274374 RepID=UPI0005CAE789|nr:BglG family transcription antiterminator [Paenibacillus antibioticophila]